MGDIRATTDNLDRLKELLFDSEAQTLADLSRRLEALTAATGSAQAEIAARIDELAGRVGSDSRLEVSVAGILDGALRKAEQDRHALVSDAVAPFVVNTVKTEIRNSKDELVEALYPVTGRIVKAYVTSAMKDLVDDINRRLEGNPVMLRLRSLSTGRSVAELAIADAQRLRVEDLYLIRRGTGELIARWPAAVSGSNRDEVMSGVLTAINEFASEAFRAEDNALRRIDLGSDRVYLRASQLYLLAARCSGSAPAAVEQYLDEGFLSLLERLQRAGQGAPPQVLSDLSQTLGTNLGEAQAALGARRLGASPAMVLAWLIGVPLVAWLAWNFYADWRTTRVLRTAGEVLTESEEIKGYPTRLAAGRLGQSVTISALVPTQDVKERVLQRLSVALPSVTFVDEIAVVPNPLAEVEPALEQLRDRTAGLEPAVEQLRDRTAGLEPAVEQLRDRTAGLEPAVEQLRDRTAGLEPRIGAVQEAVDAMGLRFEREAERRELDRAQSRLSRAKATLTPLPQELPGEQGRRAAEIVADLDRSLADLVRATRAADASAGPLPPTSVTLIKGVADRTRAASRDLSGLIAARPAAGPDTPPRAPPTPVGQFVAEAEQIDIIAVALAQTVALKRSLPGPSARERLEAWTRANAVFFDAESEYRDPETADRQLRELALLMKESGSVVRVVGYTDGLGGLERNSPLSQSRADKVAADLRTKGAPVEKIVVLGRAFSVDISSDLGPGSPNRRVEFEVGFDGESARSGPGQ